MRQQQAAQRIYARQISPLLSSSNLSDTTERVFIILFTSHQLYLTIKITSYFPLSSPSSLPLHLYPYRTRSSRDDFFFVGFREDFASHTRLWLRLKSLWLIKFTSFVMRCKTIWKYLCTWSRWASVCCTSSKKSKYFCCSFRHFSCLWDHSTTRHVLHFFFWFARLRCIKMYFYQFLGGKSFWIWFRVSVICMHLTQLALLKNTHRRRYDLSSSARRRRSDSIKTDKFCEWQMLEKGKNTENELLHFVSVVVTSHLAQN